MDNRVTEFHCIMPLTNVPSVLSNGILSYERASLLTHHSVAMQAVQDKRDQKQIPGGLKLHQYANLYFHARNPMMYVRRNQASELCVLRVTTVVCETPGVVFADSNASSEYVRFLAPATQWKLLNFDDIYAMDWRHPGDPIAYWRHKARKCAEILVPHSVHPQFLVGAYVADSATATRLERLGFPLQISVDPVLFFR